MTDKAASVPQPNCGEVRPHASHDWTGTPSLRLTHCPGQPDWAPETRCQRCDSRVKSMSWEDERCERSDLLRNACSHCRGIKSPEEEEQELENAIKALARKWNGEV